MALNKNRTTSRKSSEIRPTVAPGAPDSYDERDVAEPKRRVAGARAQGTIDVAAQKLDESSGPDTYDGRSHRGGRDGRSKGKEPGGRWSAAYYESGPKVISRNIVRDAGEDA